MPRLNRAAPSPAHERHRGGSGSLRIAVIGGGPAGSFFALCALKHARAAGRDISITIFEGRDFRRFGPPGCNMCAGIVPVSELSQLWQLGIKVPSELILSRISAYSLHTSAGILSATQPDARAEIISVYRGAGPRRGQPLSGLISFDELLIQEAVSRGATLRRSHVDEIRRGPPLEVVTGGASGRYDLVVLATGVNGKSISLQGLDYRPPPTRSMCQTELYLGQEEVLRRLASSVHVFLPPDDIATYGILIPKGPYVTVSLLNARRQMRSLCQFLELDEVRAILGVQPGLACGCLPKISVGLARNIIEDGFVAIGDASATRLYKNGIGLALATAERAAWTAIHHGYTREDLVANYLPLCHAINSDNRIGRLLFLQVPVLKRVALMPMAHHRLAATAERHPSVNDLHSRILWGMFTGAYSYGELFRMAVSPGFVLQLTLALGRAALPRVV